MCEVESFQCSSYTIVYFPMGNFGILAEKDFMQCRKPQLAFSGKKKKQLFLSEIVQN